MVDAPPKPRRNYEIDLFLGADSKEQAVFSLREIADLIERGEIIGPNGCSGGYSAGWHYTIRHDELITHDMWAEGLNKYLEYERKKEPTP